MDGYITIIGSATVEEKEENFIGGTWIFCFQLRSNPVPNLKKK